MHFEPGLVALLVALDCPPYLLDEVYRSLAGRMPQEKISDVVNEVVQAIHDARMIRFMAEEGWGWDKP